MCVRRDAQHRELKLTEYARIALITVVIVAVSTNGPTGCLVSPPPLSSQNISSRKRKQQAVEMAATQRADCCWLLLFLMLHFPGLGWVGTDRKSGQSKKSRRDSYPNPRWRGPSCRAELSLSHTFPPLAVPPIAVPPLALPSHSTMLAGPLLSRAGGDRSMPSIPAQNVLPGAHRRHVNSCSMQRERGYRSIPPDLPGGLLQLQRLFSVAGFRLTHSEGVCVCVCVYLLNCT